jgi:glycosyltransferase involved in cell wall biosynthesis
VNVLIVGTGGSIVSGISTFADEMADALRTMGHEVERLNAGERMRRRANHLNVENVRAVLGDARAVYRRARATGADVVWVHTFGVPVLPALRALALVGGARLAGSPAVVHFHAFGLERLVVEGGWRLRVLLRALERLASRFVAIHGEAATALRRAATRAVVHVLPNWVQVPEEVAALPPQPPLRAVFVGGLVRRKGVPQLLEAMRALDGEPVELRLVGGAGEDGEEALACLRAGADDLVVAGRVSFAGERDAAGVRAELRAAHLFVLPSEAEGMPIAMLEAMAEGRAVLATAAGNMRSVVEETGCGWVLADREPSTIAAHVRRLASDPGAVAVAASRARHAAVERFSAAARRREIDAILGDLR